MISVSECISILLAPLSEVSGSASGMHGYFAILGGSGSFPHSRVSSFGAYRYRSGPDNSNTVNSKIHLIRSF